MRSVSSTASSIYGGYHDSSSQKQSCWLKATCFQDELQLIWFLTHTATITSFLFYSLMLFNSEKPFLTIVPWYQILNYSCIFTYSIVTYKRYLCENKIEGNDINGNISISYILKTENVQLIICSCLWMFTEESIFKLIPFFICSVLNISCFFVFETYPEAPFAVATAPLICYLKDPLLIFSGFIDIIVIGILAKEALHKGVYYSLFLYTFIWGLKMENSDACRVALCMCIEFFDIVVIKKVIPLKVQTMWTQFKSHFWHLLPISTNSNIKAKTGHAKKEPKLS